jgi:uncharacterized protein
MTIRSQSELSVGRQPVVSLAHIALAFLLPLLATVSCAANAPQAPAYERLALVGSDGVNHSIQVEVMRTPMQLYTGLRWRKHMDADKGMLFDLGTVRPAVFTMSDTIIPLDMLFIGADGRVVNIDANTTPGKVGPFTSQGPVRAVLELNAGTAARLKIAPGDEVQYAPLFPIDPNVQAH